MFCISRLADFFLRLFHLLPEQQPPLPSAMNIQPMPPQQHAQQQQLIDQQQQQIDQLQQENQQQQQQIHELIEQQQQQQPDGQQQDVVEPEAVVVKPPTTSGKMVTAIDANDRTKIISLVEAGENPNSVGGVGRTAIMNYEGEVEVC
jgi:hypothetical protein